MVDPLVVAEGAAVPAGLEPDQGVGHGQDAEEQHHQQQKQIEVVVLRRLETIYFTSHFLLNSEIIHAWHN